MTTTTFTHEETRLFEIEVRQIDGPCVVHVGQQFENTIRVNPGAGQQLIVPVVSNENLAVDGRVRVEQPNEIVSVRPVSSFAEPFWVSSHARSYESPDVVADGSQENLRLADGWAPRELVGGEPVRWLGSSAHFEFDPETSFETLVISGVIGPCLGRESTVTFWSGGELVTSTPLDLEDGQPFELEFKHQELLEPGRLMMRIDRPYPRFTSHDVRVLNLLVREVTLR